VTIWVLSPIAAMKNATSVAMKTPVLCRHKDREW
jgi:hypothetical protein